MYKGCILNPGHGKIPGLQNLGLIKKGHELKAHDSFF